MPKPTENPLLHYKKANKLTWKKVVEQTGMPIQSIYSFIKYKPKDILLCRIGTALMFKKKLGIDLLDYVDKNIKK